MGYSCNRTLPLGKKSFQKHCIRKTLNSSKSCWNHWLLWEGHWELVQVCQTCSRRQAGSQALWGQYFFATCTLLQQSPSSFSPNWALHSVSLLTPNLRVLLCPNYPSHCAGWDFKSLAMTQMPFPQASSVPCALGFCLASLGFFDSPERSSFFSFPWPWKGCSSNPSAAFRSELDGLVLVRDQRPAGNGRGHSVSASRLGKKPRWRENVHLLHLLRRGDRRQRLTRFHIRLPELLLGSAGGILCLAFSLKTHAIFSLPRGKLLLGFFLSLAFWVFVPVGRVGGEGAGVGKVWQFNI